MKFASAVVAVVGVAQAAQFRSGSVSSFEKFHYGKFETKMKTPDKMGTVSSFFTYWDGPDFTPSQWNELDIEIVPSVEHNPFSMNAIYGDGTDKKESHKYAPNFNPHDEWHTYTMEWTPDYISWSVDGHELRHVTTEDPAVGYMAKEQTLRMNFWTPTFDSWGHGLDASDMPWYVLYDYVEVSTYDHDTNEFNLHWRDDFDNYDTERWHKASGSFDANSSVFHPENVYVKGGNLILKMEPEPTTLKAAAKPILPHPFEVAASFEEPILHHPHERQHLHKSEHFDREHIRSHRRSHDTEHADKRFWRISKEEEEAQAQEPDNISITLLEDHHHHHEPVYHRYVEEHEDVDYHQ